MNTLSEYLDESLLKSFINERFSIKFSKKKIKELNIIPDFVSEDGKVIIEFDGYYHYINTKNIIRDSKLKNYCLLNHITLIQIPYFIQLNSTEIIKYYFDGLVNSYNPFNTYSHGFNCKNNTLPSDFCYYGLLRFINEFNNFPIATRCELLDKSLETLNLTKDFNYLTFLPSNIKINEKLILEFL